MCSGVLFLLCLKAQVITDIIIVITFMAYCALGHGPKYWVCMFSIFSIKVILCLRECHEANQVKQDNVDSVAIGQATKDVIINETKVQIASRNVGISKIC